MTKEPTTRGLTYEAVLKELWIAEEIGNDAYVERSNDYLRTHTGAGTDNARSYHIWHENEAYSLKAIARMAQYKASGETTNHNSQKYYDVLKRMGFRVAKSKTSIEVASRINSKGVDSRVLARVLARTGQADFRKGVFALQGSKCIFSGCVIQEALEAAHIIPYVDTFDDHPENGLPMRCDLHRLFDRGLICISPKSGAIVCSDEIQKHWQLPDFLDLEKYSEVTVKKLATHFERFSEDAA